jgi:hypothetical protein
MPSLKPLQPRQGEETKEMAATKPKQPRPAKPFLELTIETLILRLWLALADLSCGEGHAMAWIPPQSTEPHDKCVEKYGFSA